MTTPFVAAAKVFADAGSELNDMSARTGLSVEALSALGHAASMTGADLGTVETASKKMQKALSAAAGGASAAEEAFTELGLDFRRLLKLSPDRQFEAVAKAIGRVQNPAMRAGLAMTVFGKSGTNLLPMIQDFDALTGEAKKFNLVWTQDDAEKADALGDAIDLLTASGKKVFNVFGASVAPILTDLALTLASVASRAIEWANDNRELLATVFKLGASVLVAGTGVVWFGLALKGAGIALGAIAALIVTLVSPLGLITAALVTGGSAFTQYTEMGKSALAGLLETATTTFAGIADALKGGEIVLAGRILWAGLRVEFQKGVIAVNAIFADWGVATQEVFSGISDRIAGSMIDAAAAIQTVFAKLVESLTTIWAGFAGLFEAIWVGIKSKFTEIDVEGEFKRINDAAVERVAQGRADLDKIEEDRKAARSALADARQPQNDARRQAAEDALKASQDELERAKAELAAMVQEAKKKADAVSVAKKPDQFREADLTEGLRNAGKTVDVQGTFSAAAVRGLGAGESVTDAVKSGVKEQKKTNDKLDKINRNLAFAGTLE